MQIEPVGVGDQNGLFDLFARCFGVAPNPKVWQWKYGGDLGVGVVAREDNHLVAHYGALIRRVLFEGEGGWALAPMDVMVAPEKRGILAKQNGLMAQTARHLFERHFSHEKKTCRLAMGFPTRRARALGAKLGLYTDGSIVDELSWRPRRLRWRERLTMQSVWLDNGCLDEWVSPLWQVMQTDFRDLVIGVRDAAWIRYRYFEHPERKYRVLGLQKRLGKRKLGVAVIHEHSEGALECMDLIAPRSMMPQLIIMLRYYCDTSKWTRLYIWVNRLLRETLMTPDVEVFDRDTRLTVTVGPKSEHYARKWWITSGDADFR